MRNVVSFDEIEILCEALVKDFIKRKQYRDVTCVDIEGFVTEYLGADLVYASFDEEDSGKVGFISDGKTPLGLRENGSRRMKVFPKSTIVIERALDCSPGESGRKRFTIAHEGGHLILAKHMEREEAAFHSEYSATMEYPQETLRKMFCLLETYANRAAACLLMPGFLVKKVLKKENAGKKLCIYGDGVLSAKTKGILQRMADDLGVSYSACLMRLKELDELEYLPIEDYISDTLGFGGDCHE